MSIVIPASEPELVEPEGGAVANTVAESLYTVAGRYEEYVDRGKASVVQTSWGWTGDAREAFFRAAARTTEEHGRMSETIERVARAVTAYADNVVEHLQTYSDLVSQKADADREREALIREVNLTEGATPGQVEHLQWRAGRLADRYRHIVAEHDTLHESVRENENRLIEVFRSATTLEGALSPVGGIPDAAQDAIDQPGAPGTGASPEEVADWWAGLSHEEREAVTAAYPELIGSADGLPAEARDDANRILLEDDLATLRAKEAAGTLSDEERRLLDNAEHVRQALDDADTYTDPLNPHHRPGGTLYLYDPAAYEGDGRVAVGIGDLDTADDLAVFTPGITTDTSDVTGYTGQMTNLYESARYNGDGSSVATLFWLGYDAPQGPTDTATLTEGRADEGGEQLADTIDGLRASRSGDPAHLTAIGHSYGSTTTSYAVADHGAAVDDLVLIGSPGAGPAEDSGDYDIGRDHVYVGRDSRDLVATFGDEGWVGKGGLGLGRDPSSEDFGATRFEAEAEDRSWHRNTGDAHGSYLDHDSESLYNLGRIVDGHGGDVNEAEQSYDPWYGAAVDPEWDRDPTSDEPGRSRTRSPE